MYLLDPVRLEAICETIASKSARWGAPSSRGRTLQRAQAPLVRYRRHVGLARRLEDHRLVRFLEAHKDALHRLLDEDR